MSHFRSSHHPKVRPLRFAGAALATTSFAVFASAVGCSADQAVVGAECASGYTQCGLVCVDSSNDPDNCGACGNVCATGVCTDGKCPSTGLDGSVGSSDAGKSKGRDTTPRREGGVGSSSDGSLGGDGQKGSSVSSDGGPPGSDGASDDGSFSDSPSGDVSVGDGFSKDDSPFDSCSPPYDNVSNCGACGVSCGAGSTCSLGDGGDYGCVPTCVSPKTACGSFCVDESSDPDNCGACGKFCPSGVCNDGVCEGSTEGDIVLIGHDYSSPVSLLTSPKLLTNAVFLPTTDPVRVLSFEHYADPVSVSNVKSVLDASATATGRKISYTVSTTDTDIPLELSISSFDVLFVYDQEAAAPGVLGPLGASWASTLATFTAAGGVVVLLDGAAGTTQEMPKFETSAELLAVSGHSFIAPGTPLDVTAPGDAIGHGVFTPYAAEPDSVFFITSELNGGLVTYVVVDPAVEGSAPVVVHKAVP